MFPPLFNTIKNVAAVKAVLGSSPRVYPHGRNPPKDSPLYAVPYAVFQIITGTPENYIDCLPDADDFVVQVDCYGATVDSATDAARVIRDAIEPVAYVTRWGGQYQDPDTSLFRYSLDVSWLMERQ